MSQPLLFVFYDNSNIWIEGKKVNQNKSPAVDGKQYHDPTWRFNLKAFLDLLQKHYKGKMEMINVYGSTPPPVDSVWQSYSKVLNTSIKIYKRSTFSGREKNVDSSLQLDLNNTANALYYFRE